jgi:hypothetical protein
MMLIQDPILDLPTAFIQQLERLGVLQENDRFMVVEDEQTVLTICSSLPDAKRELAAILIERLDSLRRRTVKPLFRVN